MKVGDRATFFFEIIQRVGCMADEAGNKLAEQTPGCAVRDRSTSRRACLRRTPGVCPHHCELRPTPRGARRCGGFGKGNFSELFRAIEEYETKSGINKI